MIIRTFFWWEWNKEKIQNEEPWFVEILNNTWNLNSTWNITTNTEQKTKTWDFEKEYSEIILMMPKYFYTSGRKDFAKDLYDEQKIYIKFSFIDDLNLYKNILSNKEFSDADLFLFPYDRNDMVSTNHFHFEWDIEWLFDNFISPVLEKGKIWFLPFAVDPMIMYSSISDLSQDSFSEITNLIYDRQPNTPLAFPVFFWITEEDYNNNWFIREYQDIVRYALIHYFKKYKDRDSLWEWININILESDHEFNNYNIKNLNHIQSIITQPECRNFPSICFQIYNFVWIRFWFLSDRDIVQQYFPHKKSTFEKISKQTVPFFSLESPNRLWGLWINKNLENINTQNAVQILLKYIKDHKKYNLRSSALPVFKEEWVSLSDNQYIWTRWYILDTWWNYIETLRNLNLFWSLIEHEISAKDFLRGI